MTEFERVGDPIEDPIGSVRFEFHDSDDHGYSIWVKVAIPSKHDDGEWVQNGVWQCVYSTAIGNCGYRIAAEYVEQDETYSSLTQLVAPIPGTPAAQVKGGLS